MRSLHVRLVIGSISGLALLAVACGGAAAPTATPTRAPAPVAPAPTATAASLAVPKGKIAVALKTIPVKLDFGAMFTNIDYPAMLEIYDSLGTRLPNGRLAPSLATSWEAVDNGLGFKFTLRKGIKFQNGEPFTAEDVKYSSERMLRPELRHNYGKLWEAAVSGVEIVDDSTVIFRLKKPNAAFPQYLDAYFLVGPKDYFQGHTDEEVDNRPVGSGPYKLVDRKIKSFITLEAHTDFWDNGRYPKVKTVELKEVPEDSTRLAMLKTGEADITYELPYHMLADIEKTKGFRTIAFPGVNMTAVRLNTLDKTSPFMDKRVRQAIDYSLNRELIAKVGYSGYAEPASVYAAPPVVGHDPSVKPYPHDVAKGKQLLTEAGYPNGFDAGTFYYTGDETIPLMLTEMFGAVGVRTKPTPLEYAAFMEKFRADKIGWIWWSGYGASNYDAESSLWNYFHSTSLYGSIDLWDKPIEKLGELTDPAQREEALKGVIRQLWEDSAGPAVVYNKVVFSVNNRIDRWDVINGFYTIRGWEYITLKGD